MKKWGIEYKTISGVVVLILWFLLRNSCCKLGNLGCSMKPGYKSVCRFEQMSVEEITKGKHAKGCKTRRAQRPFQMQWIKGAVSPRFSTTWKSSEGLAINWKSSNNCLTLLNALYLSKTLFKPDVAMDRWERSGLKLENVGSTFSSLTVLLEENN